MREFFRNLSESVQIAIIILVTGAILVGGWVVFERWAYPAYLENQRKAVEQSDSFVDSNNMMLQTYINEYNTLDTKIAEAQGDETLISAYLSQQKSIINLMCTQISTMAQGTVNPNTNSFLASKGGCR